MKNEWSKLRTSLNFNSKTFKFHDSIHKPRRIRLFGPLKIMSCRPFEKFHFTRKSTYKQKKYAYSTCQPSIFLLLNKLLNWFFLKNRIRFINQIIDPQKIQTEKLTNHKTLMGPKDEVRISEVDSLEDCLIHFFKNEDICNNSSFHFQTFQLIYLNYI